MRAVGPSLQIEAPPGVISATIADEVRRNKAAILAILGGRAAAPDRLAPTQPRGAPLPLGMIQQRIWLHSVLEPESILYNLPAAWRLDGALDRRALDRAFTRLVERQEVLRTVIDSHGGAEPRMRFTPPAPIALPVLDLTDLPAEQREAAMAARLEAERDESFDFVAGPLYRTLLVVVSPRQHVLFFMPHHVIWDGWSFDLFLGELAELYEAEVAGRAPSLTELPVQYADYAVGHRDWIERGGVAEQMEYWKRQLASPLPVLQLPTDLPRPAYLSHRGHWESFVIEGPLLDGIRALGRSANATLATVLMAVWNMLLYRYGGHREVLVGAPIQNRTATETEGLIGPFVNTVVLRTEIRPEESFRALLRRVRETSIDALTNQEVPVELLIEQLVRVRDTSHAPLFQAMFSHQQTVRRPKRFADLSLSQVFVNPAASAVDLTFAVMEDADRVRAVMHYSSDLFEPATVRRMCDHISNLLRSVVADPDGRVGSLPMLSDSERAALLELGTGPTFDVPDVAVQDLVARAARRSPDALAVAVENGASLTYGELLARCGQIAEALREHGVRRGGVVGVSLPRSIDLVPGLLAIFEVGAGYLPLDPDFPHERLTLIASDSGMDALLTTSEIAERVPDLGSPKILLDQLESRASPASPWETGGSAGSDVAYLIYTSGSTGRPKGVEVTHRNAVNFLLAMAERPGLSQDDVLLAVTTPSFDISVLELFGPLVVGGRVVLASQQTAGDGIALGALLERSNANAMQATPATWRMLFDSGWPGDSGLRALVGGEACPPELARKLSESCGEVWNMYGPTETTVWSTCWCIPSGAVPMRIGTPIGNTRVYVLDTERELLPLGVPGELYIGGAGVARGYRGRPDLTAERFLPDPFSAEAGARMYRTGDRVRLGADGALEYLARLDNQVKVRGFRVELGEVEAVLAQHASIDEAVVQAFGVGTPDARLVAYVVVKAGEELTVSEVRRYLGTRLPRYMIPGFVVELVAMPRTPNGKVDRAALADPLQAGRQGWAAHADPDTESERIIAEVWREVLTVQSVGKHDNFFELGGHSLLSLRAAAAIQERTGRWLDPRSFFFQSLEQLGARLEAADASPTDTRA